MIRVRSGARELAVAAIELPAGLVTADEGRARLAELVQEALAGGAQLVVAPELAVSGYVLTEEEARAASEPAHGPTAALLAQVIAGREAVVVCGIVEVDPTTGLLANTAIVVGAGGLVTRYRKTHLWVDDTAWAMPGDEPPELFEVAGVRVACLICADVEIPEFAGSLMPAPEIWCLLAAWPEERAPALAWWARARDTGAVVVAADRIGVERGVRFAGGSCVILPSGEIVVAREGPGIASATVAVGPARSADQAVASRPTDVLARVVARDTGCFARRELARRTAAPFAEPSEGTVIVGVRADGPVTPAAVASWLEATSQRGAPVVLVLPELFEATMPAEAWYELLASSCARSSVRACALVRGEGGEWVVDTAAPEPLRSAEGLPLVSAGIAVGGSRLLADWWMTRYAADQGAFLLACSLATTPPELVPQPRPVSRLGLPPVAGQALEAFSIPLQRAVEFDLVVAVATTDGAGSPPSGAAIIAPGASAPWDGVEAPVPSVYELVLDGARRARIAERAQWRRRRPSLYLRALAGTVAGSHQQPGPGPVA